MKGLVWLAWPIVLVWLTKIILIMNFATDPLLYSGSNPMQQVQQYTPQQLAALDQELTNKINAVRQQQITMQPEPSKTPVWDEIDKLMDGLTEGQKQFVIQNEEYQESNQAVVGILNREYLKIMRPIVEQTKDGKDALDKHLTLLKRLRKSAMQEGEQRQALMDDYIKNHADMTWAEYMAMRQQKGGKQ